jgi:hypothetical protein
MYFDIISKQYTNIINDYIGYTEDWGWFVDIELLNNYPLQKYNYNSVLTNNIPKLQSFASTNNLYDYEKNIIEINNYLNNKNMTRYILHSTWIIGVIGICYTYMTTGNTTVY